MNILIKLYIMTIKITTTIITILFTFSIISCRDTTEEYLAKKKIEKEYFLNNRDSILKITNNNGYNRYYNLSCDRYFLEGCEYIRVDNGNSTWGSHKGNCTNPIHNYNSNKLYTEKEVLDILRQYSYDEHLISQNELNGWFKQFKK